MLEECLVGGGEHILYVLIRTYNVNLHWYLPLLGTATVGFTVGSFVVGFSVVGFLVVGSGVVVGGTVGGSVVSFTR